MDVARGLSIVLTKSAHPPATIPWMENNSKAPRSKYRQKKSSPSLMQDIRSKSAATAKSTKKPMPTDDLTIVSSVAPHWAKISHIISDNISLKLKRVS
jgi:hypothetical protein